jgi:hypothetical protein
MCCCEDPTDHVFVNLDAEGESDLLGNALAAPSTIAPFHFNDGFDQLFGRSFGAWSPSPFR